ncbi:VWA domain-containing protein [Thermosipho globiformans]|uniref:VWA domain-containing protein n=1 Tax=Thermosipho globiformans TaxID=380685 RepID=UPI000F8CB22A|nr:VWA domain-containing protein [Thermosipho globiformans]
MKKTLLIISISVSLLIILFSCTNIPTLPQIIPADPEGVTKPDPALYNDLQVYISSDKNPFLVPLSIPDYVRVKISVPELSNLTEENLKVFEDGKAQGFLVFKESETRSNVDIMIVLDTTGSMGPAIEGVKSSIKNFIDTLEASGLNVKVGIVPYDDAAPAKDITLTKPWQDLTDLNTARNFVDEIPNDGAGGDDLPENPYAGIMYAWNNASWRSSSQKIIILITDASAHYKSEINPGNAAGETLYDKNEVISAIQGYVTVHGAFVPVWYSESTTDYTSPDDPREIVQKTGGIIKYTDSSGNVDLTSLGILEYVQSSWIIAFESDSPSATHTIEVFIEKDGRKGYSKLEDISY